jgi:hypothetical protein
MILGRGWAANGTRPNGSSDRPSDHSKKSRSPPRNIWKPSVASSNPPSRDRPESLGARVLRAERDRRRDRARPTLANDGIHPETGAQVVDAEIVRDMLAVALTCGMYDYSGEWAFSVGIPAKSGVGGGIVGVLPGVGGLAVYSPRLDEHGNSVRGLRVFEELSRRFGLHLFGPARPWVSARSVAEVAEDVTGRVRSSPSTPRGSPAPPRSSPRPRPASGSRPRSPGSSRPRARVGRRG